MTHTLINRTVSLLYRYNQRFLSKRLQEYSLPVEAGQVTSLIQVFRNPGISQDLISENAGLDKGTVCRALQQLENSGLVTRTTDEKDRRINRIFVTPPGIDICVKIEEIIKELHNILYQGFTDEEIETAVTLLIRMKSNITSSLNT